MSMPGEAKSSNDLPANQDGEYYTILSLPDEAIHTAEHPFCNDMSCPCHEDQESIQQLGGYYQEGLVSEADAERIYRGKTLR